MLLTVSGPPGSGTSTVAAALADQLGYEHVSGGDIFRELAAERDLSLAEFNELAERDGQIDRDLDRRLRETAKNMDDVVLESRLAGWLAGDHADIRIWLGAPLDARAERIADREDVSPDAAREQTRTRERSETQRYREYYDIPFDDLSIYDLSLNTARWDADAVLAIVTEAVDRYTPAGDEGAMPVEGVRYEF